MPWTSSSCRPPAPGSSGQPPAEATAEKDYTRLCDTLLAPNGQAFRKALLIQWPSPGMWTIAFLTGTPGGGKIGAFLPKPGQPPADAPQAPRLP